MSGDNIDTLRFLASQGLLSTEIANEIGVSKDTIKAWAIKNFIKITTLVERQKMQKDLVTEMLLSKCKIKDIRAKGFSYEFIRKTANERNIEWVRTPAQRGKERRLSLEDVQKRIKTIHGDVISMDLTTYVSTLRPARFIDKDYGEWWTTPSQVMRGKGHRQRGRLRAVNKGIDHGNYEMWDSNLTVRQFANKEGVSYTYLLSMIKLYGKEHTAGWVSQHVKYKSNLEILFSKIDWPEGILIEDTSSSSCVDIRRRDGYRYRPDFRVSYKDRTVYVETDGLFYHSEQSDKPTNYHMTKQKDFMNSGMRILQFRQDEIVKNSHIIRSIVLANLGFCRKHYFARKLTLKEVHGNQAELFFNQNHLMGAHEASSCVGLYDGDTLVSALSYRKYKNGIDISRFCSVTDTVIVGGLSRLLNYIIRGSNPDFVQSFVDLRYGDGHSLIKLGFKLEGTTLGWKWTDGNSTFNRMACRASMDSRGLSEREYAKELGWYRIYDAGQAKFILSC